MATEIPGAGAPDVGKPNQPLTPEGPKGVSLGDSAPRGVPQLAPTPSESTGQASFYAVEPLFDAIGEPTGRQPKPLPLVSLSGPGDEGQTDQPEQPIMPVAGEVQAEPATTSARSEHSAILQPEASEGETEDRSAEHPLEQELINKMFPEHGEEGDVPVTPTMLETWGMLSESQRIILELKYLDGASYTDIGDQIGVSRQAVNERIDILRRDLREGRTVQSTKGLSEEETKALWARAYDMYNEFPEPGKPKPNYRSVGEALGVSRETVRDWVAREFERRQEQSGGEAPEGRFPSREKFQEQKRKNAQARLDQDQEIYRRVAAGDTTLIALGEEYGLSPTAIRNRARTGAESLGEELPPTRPRGPRPKKDKG